LFTNKIGAALQSVK